MSRKTRKRNKSKKKVKKKEPVVAEDPKPDGVVELRLTTLEDTTTEIKDTCTRIETCLKGDGTVDNPGLVGVVRQNQDDIKSVKWWGRWLAGIGATAIGGLIFWKGK